MSVTFRLLRVPVRLHAWFVLTAVILFQGQGVDWSLFPLWALIVLQGVLMHEFGHALTGRAFGLQPFIELTAFAGLTRWAGSKELTPFRSILVSAAGPAVGIVIGSAALVGYIIVTNGGQTSSPLSTQALTLAWLAWVNLGWGVFNLVPIMPLDGGNIMASFFRLFSPEKGARAARYVSLVVIAVVGVLLFAGNLGVDPVFTGIFLAMFAFGNVQALRRPPAKPGATRTVEELLKEGYEALEASDGETAAKVGSLLAANIPADLAKSDPRVATLRDEAFHMLAWGRLLMGEASEARAALDSLSGAKDPDPALDGAVSLALGRAAEAIPLFERALSDAPAQFVETRWVTAVSEVSGFRAAREFALQHEEHVSDGALHALSSAALSAGEMTEALAFAERWFERSNEGRAAVQAACCLARSGDVEGALQWLERAQIQGFDDLGLLDHDEDLQLVRDTDAWPELRGRFGVAPTSEPKSS